MGSAIQKVLAQYSGKDTRTAIQKMRQAFVILINKNQVASKDNSGIGDAIIFGTSSLVAAKTFSTKDLAQKRLDGALESDHPNSVDLGKAKVMELVLKKPR